MKNRIERNLLFNEIRDRSKFMGYLGWVYRWGGGSRLFCDEKWGPMIFFDTPKKRGRNFILVKK